MLRQKQHTTADTDNHDNKYVYAFMWVVVGAQARLAGKHQWVESQLGRVTHDEYQVLGSTFIPNKFDTLVH